MKAGSFTGKVLTKEAGAWKNLNIYSFEQKVAKACPRNSQTGTAKIK